MHQYIGPRMLCDTNMEQAELGAQLCFLSSLALK